MSVSVTFFTVVNQVDYEYLLGAIEHHAGMGRHLVLDTTVPDSLVMAFKRLPESVSWIREPLYGSGWKEFKLRSAVERARVLAREMGPSDVMVYLDADEFYTPDSVENLFPHALEAMVEVQYSHWRKDGFPYIFGESEWHRRLWPAWGQVTIGFNRAWPVSPHYNGNPEHHPVPTPPANLAIMRVPGNFRHHLHYALGPKADMDETALTTIAGWPDKGIRIPKVPWPPKLALWRDKGIRPSESFL